MDSLKERFLYHESGHAVMSLAAGLPFEALIQAGEGANAAGMLWLGRVSAVQLSDERFKTGYILASLGGAMAEDIRYDGGGLVSLQSGLGSTDLRNLLKAELLLKTPLLLAFSAISRKYLRENWRSVEALASELKERPLLLHSDVKIIVGDIPSIPCLEVV